MYMNLHAAVTE